ncbi:hypothetical protein HJB86_14685 [Rhizobium sp. NZLR3b]|uniref:hypothetical protein n=1 Tax=Rhizobium sp. NZLR3b TaxID=2731101 RepID=UPI001C830E74|nr:hypothetical protein [Rhizobium sp. NZLR3b]MBX5190154.1 hypothetical protein [Rhizobium sp. NZLR3b]
MSIFLGHLGAALIIGAFFFCAIFAMAAARGSGRESQREEAAFYRRRPAANQN